MILALLAVVRAATCELASPPDSPFAVAPPEDPGGAVVLLVIHVDESEPEALAAGLAALDARGVKAGLAIRVDHTLTAHRDTVLSALESGHQAVVRLPTTSVNAHPEDGPPALRKTLKPLHRQVGKVHAVESGLGDRGREAVLHRVGLRAVLETNGPGAGAPRDQVHLEGQLTNGVVLPAGPYAGPCGTSPVGDPFTPRAADRATQALYGARQLPLGMVRVTLTLSDADEVRVLERWLDEVVSVGRFPVLTPGQARNRALDVLRSTAPSAPPVVLGGRLVGMEAVRQAAASLAEGDRIPRQLPGDLNPTEAYQALALLLAGRIENDVVRLRALEGPGQLTTVALTEPLEVPRAEVVALATAILAELPAMIPPALPVGGKLLSAAEVLTLFASAARGDDPAIARPIGVPEPNAPGLGFGSSETP